MRAPGLGAGTSLGVQNAGTCQLSGDLLRLVDRTGRLSEEEGLEKWEEISHSQWPLPFLARQKASEVEDKGCEWMGGMKGKNTRSASQA